MGANTNFKKRKMTQTIFRIFLQSQKLLVHLLQMSGFLKFG